MKVAVVLVALHWALSAFNHYVRKLKAVRDDVRTMNDATEGEEGEEMEERNVFIGSNGEARRTRVV